MSAYAFLYVSPLRCALFYALILCGCLHAFAASDEGAKGEPLLTAGAGVGTPSVSPDVQDMSADALVSSARLALSLIDAGEFSRLWRLSASDTKGRLQLPAFTEQMQDARRSVGHISTRHWAGIARVRHLMSPLKDAVAPGLYANVEFASRQLDGGAVFELVTLRIEEDGSLKFAGYAPRFKALDFAAQATNGR